MRVRDIMSRPAQTCRLGTSLLAASRRMRETGCGALAVIDPRGRVAGMLTDRDLAVALADAGGNPGQVTVAHYMSTPARTTAPEDDLHAMVAEALATAGPSS